MAHGGLRPNAGRPKGQGKYQGEATKPVRIPLSRVAEVRQLLDTGLSYQLPLYGCSVRAGFPSPADDYIEMYLDLNSHLIAHPSATFFVKAAGDSMIRAGISEGDMLVVDRSLAAQHGKIIVAAINGELTVKRLSLIEGQMYLMPENPKFSPLHVTEEMDVVIWGVVIHVIKSF